MSKLGKSEQGKENHMSRWLTLCLVIALAGISGAGGWQSIQDDYLSGKITADQRAEFALMLLENPQLLPPEYQIDRPMKDATGMIVEIMSEKDILNPQIIHRYSTILARQSKQKYYDTPEGHFRIHYDTVGTHAVYQPTVDTMPADGHPDYVNRTGSFLERAWTYECDTLSYDTPPFDGSAGGGTNLYDVYMHHYSGAYGVTWPESPSSQRPGRGNDYTSYIFVDPTYSGFGYSNRDLPMQVTTAHEFFHAVQMAYNVNAGSWFMENCATWMEDVIWDAVNDNYAYIPSFFNNPHMSLTTANGGYEYGAFLWPTYLEERFGFGLIHTIWEWTITNTAYSAVIQVLDEYATGIVAAFPEFATWNYLTGGRNDGRHYDEASSYPQVRIMRTHTTFPVTSNTSANPPNALGCNYVRFVRGSYSGQLRIQFNGADGGGWVVPVVKSLTTNNHEFDSLVVNSYGDGELIIPDFNNYSLVCIIPCALQGSSQNFTYSAYIDSLVGISDDAAVARDFTLLGNFPNPFNGSTIIQFSVPAGHDRARLEIYDILGRRVSANDFAVSAGINNLTINDRLLADGGSGTYFYRLLLGEQARTGKMTFLK